jgi:hypothetical protein
LLSKGRLTLTNTTVTERTVNLCWKIKFLCLIIELSVHDVANNKSFAGVLTVADVPAAASLKLVASFKVLLLAFLPVLARSLLL